MYRKALLLPLMIVFFGLGFVSEEIIEYLRVEQPFLFSGIVHSYKHKDHSVLREDSFVTTEVVANEICAHIYPTPASDADCLDTINHGIAHSFDPHTAYRDAIETRERQAESHGTLEGIGVTIVKSKQKNGFTILNMVPGGVAKDYGIKPGDEIMSVDNIPTVRFHNVAEVARAIRGVPGTRVVLEVRHKDSTETLRMFMVRKSIPRPQVEGSVLHSGGKDYLFIHAHHFGEDFAEELRSRVESLMHETKDPKGLIISLEDNPGGSLYEVIAALDLFMDAKSFVLERGRDGIQEVDNTVLPHVFGDITNGLPILVLVNGSSASASEIFAGAMQHFGRALVYGTKTFGKGTVQEIIALPQGEELSVTIAEYLIGTKEDWVPVQCLGITPDVVRKQRSSDKEEHFECMDDHSIASGGPMQDPPKHLAFATLHPHQYKSDLDMIRAYETSPLNKENDQMN